METSRLFRLSPRGESGIEARAPRTSFSGRRRRWGEGKPITVSVVDNMEDLKRVFFLRTGASLGGTVGSQVTDIDATDFTATHLLAWRGDEPSGCVRIRIDAGRALIDRFVIRKSRSRTMMAEELIDTAIQLSRRKGATTIICDESVASLYPANRDQVPMEIGPDPSWDPWSLNGEPDLELLSEVAANRRLGS